MQWNQSPDQMVSDWNSELHSCTCTCIHIHILNIFCCFSLLLFYHSSSLLFFSHFYFLITFFHTPNHQIDFFHWPFIHSCSSFNIFTYNPISNHISLSFLLNLYCISTWMRLFNLVSYSTGTGVECKKKK